MYSRGVLFLLILSVLVLVLGGCGEKAVYDLEQLRYINAYVNEIIPAVEETGFDFDLWSADLSSEEKRDWLKMDADKIRDIKRRYLTDKFPPYEEIEIWLVPVSDGEEEWTIEGENMASALAQMEQSSEELVLITEQIVQADDVAILTAKRDQMEQVLSEALEAAEKLGTIFRVKKIIDVSGN